MDSFLASFDDIVDPRIQRTKRYPLSEIMFLSLVGAICGIKSWRGLEDLAEDRLDWLRTYFPFAEGVPSHQTIGRVMSLLAPDSLVKAFTQFLATLYKCDENEVIALDGKTLRRSFDKASGQKPLHILNAWAVHAGVSIGQITVDSKTNEITAVPDLLNLLDIRHATITTDALNTQKNIAETIVERKAHYALPVKGNHKSLEEAIKFSFDTTAPDTNDPHLYQTTTEKGHGRIETREYRILSADAIEQKNEWPGLVSLGQVVSTVLRGEKETVETRFYLLSFEGVARFASTIRGHWQVENQLHWVLDVTFREDDCRVRKDNAPANFSLIRKLALNILRSDKTSSLSIPRKQARASRNIDYLDQLLDMNNRQ